MAIEADTLCFQALHRWKTHGFGNFHVGLPLVHAQNEEVWSIVSLSNLGLGHGTDLQTRLSASPG